MINKIQRKLKGEFLKNFLLLAIATFFGKGLGFFKEMMIANYFGTSHELDILIFSLTLAGTFLTVLSGGMGSSVLPNYLRFKNISLSKKNTYLFAVFTIFIILILFVYVLILFAGKDIINLITPGFSSQDVFDASIYLNMFIVYIAFAFLSVFFMILLKAEKKFFVSGIIPSLIPASIMLLIYFQYAKGVVSIAYGLIIGAVLQLLVSWIKSHGYFSWREIQFNELVKNYKSITKKYSVLLGSGLFIGLIGITDQSFATMAGVGAVSSLSYAQKLPALLDGVIVMILGTILFSTFAENVALSKHSENQKFYIKTLKVVTILTVSVSVFLSFFSKELVDIVFVRGKFDYSSLMMVYPVQTAFFLKLPFIAIAIISARMMNSYELNKEMLYINVFSFALNGILDYVLVTRYGVVGIAYATLFTYMWAASLNYLVVSKHFNKVVQ
ncbi:MAG TPA: hypothetical protein EYG89_01810 [Bacteroidia bacterium]|nr:hypothetical protein [Bacteroidia bacterium]